MLLSPLLAAPAAGAGECTSSAASGLRDGVPEGEGAAEGLVEGAGVGDVVPCPPP